MSRVTQLARYRWQSWNRRFGEAYLRVFWLGFIFLRLVFGFFFGLALERWGVWSWKVKVSFERTLTGRVVDKDEIFLFCKIIQVLPVVLSHTLCKIPKNRDHLIFTSNHDHQWPSFPQATCESAFKPPAPQTTKKFDATSNCAANFPLIPNLTTPRQTIVNNTPLESLTITKSPRGNKIRPRRKTK